MFMQEIMYTGSASLDYILSAPSSQPHAYFDAKVCELQLLKDENATIPFTIVEVKEEGFAIKANEFFGFLSFNYMPWRYDKQRDWQYVARHLIGQKFSGKINLLSPKPRCLIMDATAHQFPRVKLEKGKSYEAVITCKTRRGIFLDLGYAFGWQHGSMLGMAHNTKILYPAKYENAQCGDIVSIRFLRYNKDKRMVLGGELDNNEWAPMTMRFCNLDVRVMLKRCR
jgi:hypothetical protein